MLLYERIVNKEDAISLVGLGYVGMPIAVAFANRGIDVIGFDLNREKIELYKCGVDPTKEETEVISEGIEDFITGNLYTDGERILYPKKDMQTSYEKIFSWYLYDPKTSEERFIIDNVDCAGFTKDGDIVVTFPRKFGFRFLKKINVDTFEEEFFIPFMLFHHPVLLDDEYVFYVSDWFDDVWFDYYIFSAKRYASVSLYHLCELSPTYLSTIYRIFIYR